MLHDFLPETSCWGDPDDRLALRAGRDPGTNDFAQHPWRWTTLAQTRGARDQNWSRLSYHVDRSMHLGHVVSSRREQCWNAVARCPDQILSSSVGGRCQNRDAIRRRQMLHFSEKTAERDFDEVHPHLTCPSREL